jgi:beta-lactamase regulating signal transducer with metallopeptidase domain/tetratricopeptide (TPR) repeat protein
MWFADLLDNPGSEALALTFLHFLWQGLAVAGLAALAARLLAGSRPGARHAVYLAAMAILAALPPITFAALHALPRAESTAAPAAHGGDGAGGGESALRATPDRAPEIAIAAAGSDSAQGSSAGRSSGVAALPLHAWIVLGWSAGVLVLSIRLLVGQLGLRRLRRELAPIPEWLSSTVRPLLARIGGPRIRGVFTSAKVSEALAAGLFRPLVIVPASWLTMLPPEAVEAVIAHELAHIRRFDPWIHLLQRVVETLLFFHPAVWWLSRRLRIERELACDRLAVSATGRQLAYASALERVARARLASRLTASAALGAASGGRGLLLERVHAILGLRQPSQGPVWAPAALVAFAVPLAFALLAQLPWIPAAALQAANVEEKAVAADDKKEKDADGPLTAECQSQIETLRKTYTAIPTNFSGLGRDRLEAVAAEVYKCRDGLQSFLANCKGRGACDAPFMLARLQTSLSARQRVEWAQKQALPGEEVNRRMTAYHRLNVALCERALACAGDGKDQAEFRCQVYDLLGDIHFQLLDFEPALKNYLAAIEGCPKFPNIGNTLVGAGRSYFELRRTEEGVKFIDKAIKDYYKDRSLPIFYEVKWNLVETAGDIEGMIAWCKDVQKVFPLRMLREGLDRPENRAEYDGYQRYLGFSGFRLGYAYFAKGDLSNADENFQKHIDYLNELEAKLGKESKALPQELQIYRQRSADNLEVLRTRIGEPPSIDLDFGDMWITAKRGRIADGKGKAVAVLFRGEGDTRSSGFLKNLDRHLSKNAENKTLSVAHFMKGSRDPMGQLEKVADEMAQLGIENAAVGMEPDAENHSIFRGLGAMVGSATFEIFDRQGRLAWWMQDPREMDSQLIIKIWERLSKE